MKANLKENEPKGAIELVEEAFHLLRKAPLRAHACYCLGSLPFLLGLLYFWTDMSKSGFAYTHVAGGAFLVALLFIWMKCWQVVYARRLLAEVRGEQPQRWTPAGIWRMIIRQTAVQPSGLFLLPLALLVTLPFGWTYALYQNMTVLEDGDNTEIMSFVKRADKLARPWQKQNFLVIWALSPYLMITAGVFYLVITPIMSALTSELGGMFLGFYSIVLLVTLLPLSPLGIVIGINIGSALVLLPNLFQMLTGLQTRFTLGMGSMFNTTFFAIVCGLTYLCMDPLVKAAYVLRCFYAESQTTGEDLKVSLKHAMGKIALILLMSFCMLGAAIVFPSETRAQEHRQTTFENRSLSVAPAELNQALERELQGRHYAWRMPRIKPSEKGGGLADSFMRDVVTMLTDWGEAILRRIQPIIDWLNKFIEWLRERSPDLDAEEGSLERISFALRIIMFSLVVLLIGAAGMLLWRNWKTRAKQSFAVATEILQAKPDLEKETTTAAELPEDGWLSLARELLERGELRLALRAVFLASLAFLARADFIRIALFKTNRDYKKELERRAHAHPNLIEVFSHSATIYESVWYGTYEPRRELIDHLLANQQKLRAYETHE